MRNVTGFGDGENKGATHGGRPLWRANFACDLFVRALCSRTCGSFREENGKVHRRQLAVVSTVKCDAGSVVGDGETVGCKP